MKEFEIFVSASYMVNEHKEWNCFHEYVTAKTEAEAKRKLKAELKKDGYIDIELSDIIAC